MLQEKWDKFVKRPYYLWCFEYVVFLMIFTSSIALRPAIWEIQGPVPTPSLTVGILEIFVLVHFFASTVFEIMDIIYLREYTLSNFGMFTIVAWLSDVSFWIAFILRLARQPVGEEFCLAVAAVFAWFYFLHLMRGIHKSMGAFVVMITEIVVFDLYLFLILYIIILLSFSSGIPFSLSLLTRSSISLLFLSLSVQDSIFCTRGRATWSLHRLPTRFTPCLPPPSEGTTPMPTKMPIWKSLR